MDYAKTYAEAEAEEASLLLRLEHVRAIKASAAALAGAAPKAAAEPVLHVKPRRTSSVMNPTRVAVAELLEEAGGPLETRDLLPKVRERGIDVGGKDPVATLSARLSNSDQFKNRRGVGWWFSDRPLPQGGHLLGSDSEATANDLGGLPAAASVSNQGGSEDAAALTSKPSVPKNW